MNCNERVDYIATHFLGALAKLRKATVSFVVSACPSSRNSWAPTVRNFMKFDIWSLLDIYYYRCSSLGPVWAETRAPSGDWYSSGTLHPGQVLRGRLPFLSPAFQTFPLSPPVASTSVRDPSGGRWNCGRECCPVILAKWRLSRHLGISYMPQICDMGQTALLPLRRKACWGFFSSLKIRRFRPGLNPRTWVLKASTLPLHHQYMWRKFRFH